MATLNVGRGFDGWSSIYAASQRLGDDDTVLYFGDFDPWGEDMMRSLRARLRNLGSRPELVKSALLFDDIERYRLPPDSPRQPTLRQLAGTKRTSGGS